ncbi:MAG TPA: YvcK family protein [Mesotoga infera]|uniref:Putative gluconeogenesis factor n=1 Tax=Mesotoga infera TaxID=1236046 RepID=A0A7C1H929_9BACT|nr:YvcK family protein [Mesotoga infera]
MSRTVLIGGGTGLSTFVRVMKDFDSSLTLVVAVTDDGGSSGIIREAMLIPPPGDVRNNIIALADDEELLTKVFSHRFGAPAMDGHSIGNIIIAGLTEMYGSFPEAVVAASKMLSIKGRVLPVADDLVHLVAELDDGSVVKGESRISSQGKRVRRISLDKPASALPEVIDAIVSADTIIVGPGSIFTSLVPNFLVSGVREAFKESRGRKIFICNIMTQPAESEGFSLRDHVEVVENYCGQAFDLIFWTEVSGVETSVLNRYKEQGSSPVENDMLFDRRVKVIEGATTVLIDDGKARLVVRHSRNSILSILHELSMLGENRI